MTSSRRVLGRAVDFAALASRHARCKRGSYGASLVDRGGILIATGANGIPVGNLSCLEGDCPHGLMPTDRALPCLAVHAEVRCLLSAGAQSAEGAIMATTGTPCPPCAAAIVSCRVAMIVMRDDTDLRTDWALAESILAQGGTEIVYLGRVI